MIAQVTKEIEGQRYPFHEFINKVKEFSEILRQPLQLVEEDDEEEETIKFDNDIEWAGSIVISMLDSDPEDPENEKITRRYLKTEKVIRTGKTFDFTMRHRERRFLPFIGVALPIDCAEVRIGLLSTVHAVD